MDWIISAEPVGHKNYRQRVRNMLHRCDVEGHKVMSRS